MENKRSKRMLKDVFLFAIASFGPKMLGFFLVPLYTSVLSTEAYGMSDLLNTVYSLILPIFMLDISDAILIYTVENKNNKPKLAAPLAYGMNILCKSSLILCVLGCGVVICFSNKDNHIIVYVLYVIFQYIINAIYYNLLAYLRGTDDVLSVVTASILYSLSTLIANVVLIVGFQWGLNGLLLSSLVGGIVADLFIAFKIKLASILKSTLKPTTEEKKAMLSYSIPLIFTGLAWWANSSSDRLFISVFVGVGTNGIYAVANKIPTILSACHNVIYQAMQLSVFNEINAEDKSMYFKRLYKTYSFLMTFVCSILILLDKVIAKFLFRGDFYVAWKYSPALLISIAIYSIAGYITTILAAEKETKVIAKSTVLGAVINTFFNFILIPRFQLFGAVIATAIGYFFIWLVMILYSRKNVKTDLGLMQSLAGFFILVLQWIFLLVLENSYLLQGMLSLIIVIIYLSTARDLFFILKRLVVEMKRTRLNKNKKGTINGQKS